MHSHISRKPHEHIFGFRLTDRVSCRHSHVSRRFINILGVIFNYVAQAFKRSFLWIYGVTIDKYEIFYKNYFFFSGNFIIFHFNCFFVNLIRSKILVYVLLYFVYYVIYCYVKKLLCFVFILRFHFFLFLFFFITKSKRKRKRFKNIF